MRLIFVLWYFNICLNQKYMHNQTQLTVHINGNTTCVRWHFMLLTIFKFYLHPIWNTLFMNEFHSYLNNYPQTDKAGNVPPLCCSFITKEVCLHGFENDSVTCSNTIQYSFWEMFNIMRVWFNFCTLWSSFTTLALPINITFGREIG